MMKERIYQAVFQKERNKEEGVLDTVENLNTCCRKVRGVMPRVVADVCLLDRSLPLLPSIALVSRELPIPRQSRE